LTVGVGAAAPQPFLMCCVGSFRTLVFPNAFSPVCKGWFQFHCLHELLEWTKTGTHRMFAITFAGAIFLCRSFQVHR
jgi:hypothetical protein